MNPHIGWLYTSFSVQQSAAAVQVLEQAQMFLQVLVLSTIEVLTQLTVFLYQSFAGFDRVG